jgi:hypothetical protein
MKTNHQRGTKSNSDSERRKNAVKLGLRRHTKNPQLGARPLTGSVHEADYPPEGWNSRIRQRENAATKKLLDEV